MENLKNYLEGVEGVIVDYCGTLDTDGTHWSWVIREAWQKAGVEVDLSTFREAYVYAEKELARTMQILPRHDFRDFLNLKINIQLQWLAQQDELPATEVEPMAAKIANICKDYVAANIETVKPVLEKLAAKYPLVLVSNFYGNSDLMMQKLGIGQYFKKVIDCSVEGLQKPDSRIFGLAVKALQLSPSRCLVVGSSYDDDIQPALEVGCRAVWLKGDGWSGQEDLRTYEFTIKNLMELL